jgi:hypothetical protein
LKAAARAAAAVTRITRLPSHKFGEKKGLVLLWWPLRLGWPARPGGGAVPLRPRIPSQLNESAQLEVDFRDSERRAVLRVTWAALMWAPALAATATAASALL